MEQFLKIIEKFKDLKVLVVGDLMLDEYIFGDVNRISPEAPIPILDVKQVTYTPGGAANAVHNVKSLGGKVMAAGVIGDDEKGRMLKKILEEGDIDASGLVVDMSRRTTLKTRVVAKNQQVVRIDAENREPISSETEERLLDFVKSQLKELNAIIISDYAKGVITSALSQKIIALAKENNVFCLVDPKGKDYSKYRNCSLITPNLSELSQALNIPLEQLESESRFLQAGKMLLAHVLSDNAVVKRHDKGMSLFEKNGSNFSCPALNKKAVDVSGAGDTAVATLALALAAGADLKQAVILASHACAIKVGKMGTAVVSADELAESIGNNPGDE